MRTNAFVLAMMVVQLSKEFIKVILVGDPVVLKNNYTILNTFRRFLLFWSHKIISEHITIVADLVVGVGSETIAVIFKFYFDVVSAALLTSAQALHVNRHGMSTCVYAYIFTCKAQIQSEHNSTFPLDQPIRSSIFWPNLDSSLLQALFLGSTDHFTFLLAG